MADTNRDLVCIKCGKLWPCGNLHVDLDVSRAQANEAVRRACWRFRRPEIVVYRAAELERPVPRVSGGWNRYPDSGVIGFYFRLGTLIGSVVWKTRR